MTSLDPEGAVRQYGRLSLASCTIKVLYKFNVCWNNVYQIVFGMHKWESVKGIQWFCERLDCIQIIHNLKLSFIDVFAVPLTMLFHGVLIGFI